MFKVIVERPRRGALSHRGWRLVRDDDLPLSGPLRPRGSPRKDLNENLAPLERFFEKRVGRYWPKVFSEVCAHISPNNAVQKHVRDHVEDIVAVRTLRQGDEILAHCRFGRLMPLRELYWLKFYVHPVSKVLMRNKHWRPSSNIWKAQQEAQERARSKRFRPVSPYCALHKIGALWYDLRLHPQPEGAVAAALDQWKYDLRGGSDLVRVKREELNQIARGYTIAKRQLSSRELAAAGLTNDPLEE
ncbi:MAG TPA: hypothetical protein VNK52_03335 [Hyphomicrobiaceae bacterium]|nr:hypothetical protein [Hyphomicrobiaceae bacterium]